MNTENPPIPEVDDQITFEIYRLCMLFATEAGGFMVETENLRRLGINAQIIAAHAGEGGRAVEVIVVEIGRLSLEVRQTLQDLSKSVSDLSKRAVGTIFNAKNIQSYHKGWQRNVQNLSHKEYIRAWEHLSNRLRDDFLLLENQVFHQDSELRALQRNAIQIPMISSLMKIVVTEIGNKGVELHHAAIELEKFNRFLTDKINAMQILQQECLHKIQQVIKGEIN